MSAAEERYCKRCYRTISSEQIGCSACDGGQGRLRGVALLGMAGLPLLVTGVLSLNVRLCVAGAAISGAAALIYAALSLR